MNELFFAIRTSNLTQISELLRNQDVNQPLWRKFSVLLYAVYLKKLEVVRFLLEHGSDVNYKISFKTESPIDMNIAERTMVDDTINKELIEDMQSLGDVTALHIAVKQNNFDVAKLLLEHNAKTDITDQGGCTPLHWAVAQNHESMIALLLRYHANTNIRDLSGSTAIDEAKRRNSTDILHLLLTGIN